MDYIFLNVIACLLRWTVETQVSAGFMRSPNEIRLPAVDLVVIKFAWCFAIDLSCLLIWWKFAIGTFRVVLVLRLLRRRKTSCCPVSGASIGSLRSVQSKHDLLLLDLGAEIVWGCEEMCRNVSGVVEATRGRLAPAVSRRSPALTPALHSGTFGPCSITAALR